MKVALIVIVILLALLAVLSGVTKIALMQQDVEFFGRYGFSEPILVAFGATQLTGGIMLPFTKTRFVGAAIVATTFLVSLLLLLLDGNIPVSIVTVVAILLLGFVMKKSRRASVES